MLLLQNASQAEAVDAINVGQHGVWRMLPMVGNLGMLVRH